MHSRKYDVIHVFVVTGAVHMDPLEERRHGQVFNLCTVRMDAIKDSGSDTGIPKRI